MVSCVGDEDKYSDNTPAEMTGKWNLVNQSGGFAGQDLNFEPGDIIWTFDTESGKIAIVNEADNENGMTVPTGTYNYYMLSNEVSPETCDKTLNLEEMDLGCVSITGNIMVFTPVGADMFTLTFKR
ncbi:MAG: hypothetical protein DI539_01005 [Flavobacterium psychrophilum]|nr:MAG: hypothetical protein DI539_01005 [Flavobacterium psychrophilum]